MVAVVGALIVIALLVFSGGAQARDDGHWEERVGVEIAKWMGALVQPDTMWKNGDHMVGTPCCGEADAYWADDVHVYTSHDGDKFVAARITDTRDDKALANRAHEEVGTEYIIPPNKVVGFEQSERGNPTGHAVIFLGTATAVGKRAGARPVLCFVPIEGM